ncbi:MAG TPA: hypothetical protein VF493_12835 [Terriglobales bacterium]
MSQKSSQFDDVKYHSCAQVTNAQVVVAKQNMPDPKPVQELEASSVQRPVGYNVPAASPPH